MSNSILRCQYCGKTKSRSRKPFTWSSLGQHERHHELRHDPYPTSEAYPHIDDDLPDGAYWAMVAEADGELD